MEFDAYGCPIPDIVIGETCVISSIGASLAIPIAIGVLFLLFSLFRRSGGGAASLQEGGREHAMDQLARTLRALIAVAAADGRLDDAEVDAIRYVGAEFFKLDFPEDMIRSMYADMGAKIDARAEVEGSLGGAGLTEPAAIEALVSGMIIVAAADGDFAEPEKVLLREICQALRLDGEVVEKVFASADELAANFQAQKQNAS